MKQQTRRWVVSGIGVTAAAVALLAARAHAAGIPAANALTYTGYLETPEGAPVTAQVTVSVALWTAASGGRKACEAEAEKLTPVSGRFQITLPDACTDAVKAQPDLWLETTIDDTALGRTKLGAVPYALEAGHAVSADTAAAAEDASGALAERLDEVEATAQGAGARLDAERAAVFRNVDFQVDVEIPSVQWTWVSGTAPADVKAGRYWLYTNANVNAGTTGCGSTCTSGSVKVAACVKIGSNVSQVGAAVYAQPQYYPAYPVPMAAFDQFVFDKDTSNVQFGLCAARPGDTPDPTQYNARIRQVFAIAMPQLD